MDSVKIKTFFILTAISSILFGLGFLVMPKLMAQLHGIESIDQFTDFLSKLLGGALIATGVLGWLVRDASPSVARRAILIFLLISDSFYSAINLIELVLKGNATTVSWLELVVTFAFTIGAIFFLRKEQAII